MDSLRARSGLEIIPRKECLVLLAGQRLGRLGFAACAPVRRRRDGAERVDDCTGVPKAGQVSGGNTAP